MNSIYLVDRDDVHRVMAGYQAGNFSTSEDAQTALRLAQSSYDRGQADLRSDIRHVLGIVP